MEILKQGLKLIAADDGEAAAVLEGRYAEISALLVRYLEEIERFNLVFGLTGTRDRHGLVVRHILDSLAPLGVICRLLGSANGARIADAGSGAGLPGIPLAIALPRHSFTLVERKKKRAGFLRRTLAALGLSNASVEEAEMEKAAPGRFDLVVSRAFHPLDRKLLKKLFRLCGNGGVLAAYKGRKERIAEETSALEGMNIQIDIVPCRVPFLDEERHILIIKGTSREALIYSNANKSALL
ncbi:MAG: 16S rRNA (guanine(527)-N(7))-methyltransferase RsmG [Treponema sp.]|jgi:16S rRNA (guanine527-N7)-methyltransferase|nr:16S rRNA (guanine(527)-N(7))-methyltransferase RsmG [Treponema sp.]